MKRMTMMVMVMAAMAGLCGCQSPVIEVVAPPLVEAGACAVLERQPAATGYVRLVGGVFTGYGRGEPPSVAAMQATLAELPAPGLDRTAATAVWAGAVAAYAGLEGLSATAEGRERLRRVLGGIGLALERAAAGCGVSVTAQRAPGGAVDQVSATEAELLAAAIERELRAWGR